MPFGLKNAPATFQRLMNAVFRDLRKRCVKVYLDDVNVHSPSWEQHLKDLRDTFERLRSAGLRLNMEKCFFGHSKLVFLGYIISREGIQTDPAKIQKMLDFEAPTDVRTVRSFLGQVGFYRRFIPGCSKIGRPLHNLTKKNQPFVWGKLQQKAFDELKKQLTKAPVLAYPNLQKEFQVYIDASYLGLGGILGQQDDDGKDHVVAYISRMLNKHELQYRATELECLGLWWAITQWHHYLYGNEFTVYTDHHALIYAQKKGFNSRKFNNWITDLQQYTFKTYY